MDVILCATRGGEASVRTQERAIEIAKERNAKLVFIFVSNLRFLHGYTAPNIPSLEGEMEHLGEFLLLIAKERAEKAGVPAEVTVKKGVFSHALSEAAREHEASLVIVGRPSDDNVTTMEFLENQLAPIIKEETGADLLVV